MNDPAIRAGGIFVTGTDTGVGKTAVAGALAAVMREMGIDVGVMKPIQTGALPEGDRLVAPDAEFLLAAAGIDDARNLVSPEMYSAPVAPLVAAEMEGRPVDVGKIWLAYRRLQSKHDYVIVEGAGGLAVPIADKMTMADLARSMAQPILIVARASLGTINHTVLTVEYARAAKLQIAGIVVNRMPVHPDVAERTSPAVIERLTGVPILAQIHEDADVDTEAGKVGGLVGSVRASGLVGLISARRKD